MGNVVNCKYSYADEQYLYQIQIFKCFLLYVGLLFCYKEPFGLEKWRCKKEISTLIFF